MLEERGGLVGVSSRFEKAVGAALGADRGTPDQGGSRGTKDVVKRVLDRYQAGKPS
jgi:hypothetical protein